MKVNSLQQRQTTKTPFGPPSIFGSKKAGETFEEREHFRFLPLRCSAKKEREERKGKKANWTKATEAQWTLLSSAFGRN
jgi:hypothetical protein